MTRTKFGSTKRKYKRESSRKQRQNNISSEINALIVTHIPELQNKVIDEHVYQLQLSHLLNILQEHYTLLDDYRIARNCLSSKINDGNKLGKYNLPIPPYIIRAKRGAIFRTQNWFIKVKALNQWKYKWHQQLASSKAENITSPEHLLASSLISAAFYGGLSLPEALVALANQLTQLNKPLIKIKNEVWFDLTFKSTTQDANVRSKNSKITITLRRWYPDAVSLAWIRHFLYCKQKNTLVYKKLDQKQCWGLIKHSMQSISPINVFTSFRSFCLATTGILENQPNVELPNALLEYVNGRLASASLTAKQQENLLNPQINNIKEGNQTENKKLAFKRFELVSKKITSYVQSTTTPCFNYEYTFELIRRSLITDFENGEKSTPTIALNSLKAIELSSLPISICILINWLIYLLEERKIAVSSSQTYFSKIGMLWATYMVDLDLRLLDEETFEELYLLMLNIGHTEQSRRDKAALLNDLHQYGVKTLNLPVLTNNNLSISKDKTQNFVKVGFISEPMFRYLCKEISMIKDVDELTVKGLICLVIIAYRLGLRRGELLKLQMRDIENSSERWLYIRENKFGNNKTSSALRKLPITALLTQEENALFIRYLTEREKTVSNSPQSLVFSKSLTPTLPFDGNSISSLVSSILKNMTNTVLSFHHLRHSALSRLHLIIEDMGSLIERYTCYSKEQVQIIRSLLLTKHNEQVHRDNYWALAGIAGHATPETTFANYLHFVDRVLFERLSKSSIHFSITEINNISAISSNYLTRHCKKEQIPPESIPIYSLYQKMVKDVSSFSTEITLLKEESTQDKSQEDELYHHHKTINQLVCMKILKETENGASVSELVYKYQINEQLIEKWIVHARAVANKKTQQGKSRLFIAYSKSLANIEQLCPQKPPSKVELDDADIALVKLRTLYSNNEALILWCVNYFTNNTTRSSTAICFTKKDDFEKFITFLIQVFPKQRWTIKLELAESDTKLLAQWQQVSHGIFIYSEKDNIKNKNIFPEGKMNLHLNHPKKDRIINKVKNKEKRFQKYSTSTLRYIFHILAIML